MAASSKRPVILLCVVLLSEGAYYGDPDYDYDYRLPQDCIVRPATTSSFVSAFRSQLATLSGCQSKEVTPDNRQVRAIESSCVAKNNQDYNNKDVHVIEVKSPPCEIDLDIVQRSKRTKHVLLVLKSGAPVVWVIDTKGVKEYLTIITDQHGTVDTSTVRVETVSIEVDRLRGRNGQELVDWTKEKYGPVVSYTEVNTTNTVVLLVDDSDTTSAPDVMETVLFRAKHIGCSHNYMKVSLNKRLLRGHGISREDVSLLDTSCIAVDNGTHFLLVTDFDSCETKKDLIGSKVVYTNAVKVRHRHSEDFEEGYFSGSGYGNHVDDEDMVLEHGDETISNFTCTYNIKNMDEDILSTSAPRLQVSVSVNHDFTSPIFLISAPVSVAEGSIVYVEVKLGNALPNQRVLVDHCFIQDSVSHDKHNLIRNRCPVDTTVKDLKTTNPQIRRFQFNIRQYFAERNLNGNLTEYKVICQLHHCSTDVNAPPNEQCLNPICTIGSVHPKVERQKPGGSLYVEALQNCDAAPPWGSIHPLLSVLPLLVSLLESF